MSDTSQGPGWWLASDGKWYPPELWTGPPMTGPTSPQGAPSAYSGQVGASPTTSAPYGSQIPPVGYAPYTSYGAPVAKRTNGLAIASLVCACGGFLLFLPAVLGVVFGFVARSQIRQSAGLQGGDGLAIAGIIVGFAWIGLFVILFIIGAVHRNTNGVVGTMVFALPGLNA